jgi:hypothetical protein
MVHHQLVHDVMRDGDAVGTMPRQRWQSQYELPFIDGTGKQQVP